MDCQLIKRLLVLLLTLISFELYAASGSVALVTYLNGSPIVGESKKLELLAELNVDEVVTVPNNGSVILVFYDKTHQYAVIGPAKFKISTKIPIKLSGNDVKFKGATLTSNKPIKINPLNVTQAAVAMRGSEISTGIALLTMHQTLIFPENNYFSWQPVQDVPSYRFQLLDKNGDQLFEAETVETYIRLPDEFKFVSGEDYKWRVSTKSPSGKQLSGIGTFKVASFELISHAKEIMHQPQQDFAGRVLVATWLLQNGFKDNALLLFKELSKEYGDNQALRILSEQSE